MNARAAVLSVLVLALAACGSSDDGGPPAGAGVQLAVHPETVEMQAGASLEFQATVTGTADTGVEWSVEEGSAGGSIAADGTYTAPATAGTYHVVATSTADRTRSARATVTVVPAGGGSGGGGSGGGGGGTGGGGGGGSGGGGGGGGSGGGGAGGGGGGVAGGTANWALAVDTAVEGIAAHASGTIAVVKAGDPAVLELRDRHGKVRSTTPLHAWSLPLTSHGIHPMSRRVGFSRLGNVFVVAREGMGGESWYLVKVSPAGEIVWSVSALAEPSGLAVDQRDGSVVLCGQTGPMDAPFAVQKFAWDGTPQWTKVLQEGVRMVDVAIAPDGAILLAGYASLEKWTAAGDRVWQRTVDTSHAALGIQSIAVSSAGRIAVTGRHEGHFPWGDDLVTWPNDTDADPSVFVLVADASGNPLWGTAESVEDPYAVQVDLDGGGGPVVAIDASHCGFGEVRAYRADEAATRWEVRFGHFRDCDVSQLRAFDVAPWGEVLVGGILKPASRTTPLLLGDIEVRGSGGYLGAFAE